MSAWPPPDEEYVKDKQQTHTHWHTPTNTHKHTQIAKKNKKPFLSSLPNTQPPFAHFIWLNYLVVAAQTSQTDRNCGAAPPSADCPPSTKGPRGAASAFSSSPHLSGPAVMAFCSLAIPSGTFRIEFVCLATGGGRREETQESWKESYSAFRRGDSLGSQGGLVTERLEI